MTRAELLAARAVVRDTANEAWLARRPYRGIHPCPRRLDEPGSGCPDLVIAPGTVASVLGEALIERVVFDGPSRVIDLGRARRFTGAVRRALEVRDRHCTHPGCALPAQRCQGDHIQPWSVGGPTTGDNGQLRCGHHNRWRWHYGDGDPPAATAPPSPVADLGERIARLEELRANLRAKALRDTSW